MAVLQLLDSPKLISRNRKSMKFPHCAKINFHFRSAAAQLSSEQKFSGQGSFEVNKLYGKTPNLTMNCTIPPSTGQLRSGHLEVNNLYGNVEASNLTMNSMNAPNNSTMQCGCENIDCPFCNLLISVQTREGSQVDTVWQFQDFSVIHIFREINFGQSSGPKNAVFCHLGGSVFYYFGKFSAFKNCKNS